MPTINPYLNFQGKAEEAFNFYKSIFGGEFVGGIRRFSDTQEATRLPENEQNKVMHIALPIGNNMFMATDALESMNQKVLPGNNIYLSLSTNSREQADTFFEELSKGGDIEMPIQDVFRGDYFGMLKDKFGVQWMISFSEG
jgi:PhnB protein